MQPVIDVHRAQRQRTEFFCVQGAEQRRRICAAAQGDDEPAGRDWRMHTHDRVQGCRGIAHRILGVAEHAQAAQARLTGIEQLSDGKVTEFAQVSDHALLDVFRHDLGIAVGAAMGLF